MGRGEGGRIGRWAGGPFGRWADGHMGRWAHGQFDTNRTHPFGVWAGAVKPKSPNAYKDAENVRRTDGQSRL